MTTPAEVTAMFVEALEAFEIVHARPTDSYVNQIFEVLSGILYNIVYDETDGTHNLIGIIQDDVPYFTKYGASFKIPDRPKIFSSTIDQTSAVTIATRKLEAEHSAKRTDWALYNCAQRNSGHFILKVVDRVWLAALSKGLPTYFADVLAKEMLDKLQEICLGNHEVDILDLQDKMRKMHTEVETVPEYVEALQDAQLQAKRAKMPIEDTTLVMIATKAMLSTGRFPKADDLWEDLDRADRTWTKWKELYERADRKAIIKRMAAGDVEQFGGVAREGQPGRPAPLTLGRPAPLTLDDLEGCMDDLAGAATSSRETLDELVRSNAKLSQAVADLSDANAKLVTKVENQAAELKKQQKANGGGGGGGGGGTAAGGAARNDGSYCTNCKRVTWHVPDNCFELEKNKSKRPAHWKSVL